MVTTAATVAVATARQSLARNAAGIASSVAKTQGIEGGKRSCSSWAPELINDGVVATSSVVLIGSFFWVSFGVP